MDSMKNMEFTDDHSGSRETREIPGAPRELPFRVPRHYFDDFPARMQATLERETATEPAKKLRLADYLKPVIGLAAAFAAVFLIVYWPTRLITKDQPLATHNTHTDEEKIINLVEHVDDHTFLNLLEGNAKNESPDDELLETYLAANYSDLEIFMEINEKQQKQPK